MSLYPEGAHWCSRADYDVVLNTAKRLNAKRVLEFGPGTTTLALIEAGVDLVDACEDDEHWFGVWSERLAKHWEVRMRRYECSYPSLTIPGVDGERYDLAVIDGPRETRKRGVSILYAMDRAKYVLVALEEHDAEPYLRMWIEELYGNVEIIESGPLAGAYALITP